MGIPMIETDGGWVNLALVARVAINSARIKGDQKRFSVTFYGNDREVLGVISNGAGDPPDIEAITGTYLPAHPGIEVVTIEAWPENYESDEDGRPERYEITGRYPVVAWRIDHVWGVTAPVTPCDLTTEKHTLVVMPNGRVLQGAEVFADSIDQAGRYILRREQVRWDDAHKETNNVDTRVTSK